DLGHVLEAGADVGSASGRDLEQKACPTRGPAQDGVERLDLAGDSGLTPFAHVAADVGDDVVAAVGGGPRQLFDQGVLGLLIEGRVGAGQVDQVHGVGK